MTKEEALRRFKAAKQTKKDAVAALEKKMKQAYEERTGLKANYVVTLWTPFLFLVIKQALRNRLFERWFSTYERKAQYTFVASSLKDDEGTENYAAIIVRNDNPDLSAIIAEFTETISLLSSKP